MLRILVLILLALAIWWLFRKFIRSATGDDEPAPKPPQARSSGGEDMVQCQRCGVNLPRSEAREEAGRLVCAANPQCR